MAHDPDPWADVRIVFDDLDSVSKASCDWGIGHDAGAMGRIYGYLERQVYGRTLLEVEGKIERPPRVDPDGDEAGMVMAYCGTYEMANEQRKLYKIECIGSMSVFFSVGLKSSAVELFCLPHDAYEFERAIKEGNKSE